MREMVSQLYYDTVTYGSTFASEGEGREGITGGANRFGCTLSRNLRAESFGGFIGAGKVGLTRIVGDTNCRIVVEELVHTGGRASMARSCDIRSTVQYILDR